MPSKISPWQPEANPIALAAIGKMGEECSELAARCFRVVIQGLDQRDPDTGLLNSSEIEREMSDVLATMKMVNLALNLAADEARVETKFKGFIYWHTLIITKETP